MWRDSLDKVFSYLRCGSYASRDLNSQRKGKLVLSFPRQRYVSSLLRSYLQTFWLWILRSGPVFSCVQLGFYIDIVSHKSLTRSVTSTYRWSQIRSISYIPPWRRQLWACSIIWSIYTRAVRLWERPLCIKRLWTAERQSVLKITPSGYVHNSAVL